MAPYLSLLPVRKTKLPVYSLPRPTSSQSTNNQCTVQPLQPTQATADPDESLLDFGSLLGGQEQEEHSFGLLNDEDVPEFLADESMWTMGGRTPAKKGLHVLEGLDEKEEEEEEEDQVEKGIARYDDSEDELRRSPPPQPADKTLSPNTTSSLPRPASTPSFRQSPASQGQALFDESMAMGNYSSNSNQSRSFAREEEGRDSTFTLDQDRPIVPEAPSREVEEMEEDAELEEDIVHEKGEEEISEIKEFETDVNQSLDNVNSRTLDSPTLEEVQQDQEVFAEETDEQVSEEQLGQPEEKIIEESEDTFSRGQEECPGQETEYSDPPEETLEDVLEEAESEVGMIEADGQNLADEESGSERKESDTGRDMDEVVPVNFNVGEASCVIQDQEKEEEGAAEPVVEIAQPAQPESASVPSPSPVPLRRRSSLAPLPSATLSTPVDSLPIPLPSKVRGRPSFSSAPLPTKRARRSIAASRPAHILPPDHPAHRRRQSVAAIGSSRPEERSKAKKTAKETVSRNGDSEATEIPAEKTSPSDIVNETKSSEQTKPSESKRLPSPSLVNLPPQQALPPVVSDSHLVIDSDVAVSSAMIIGQSKSNSLPTLPLKATTPPAESDTSLPLSPDSHEPTSFEGDLTLPMMGAPLSFNPSSLEIGHSTPAKLRPRSSLRSEEEEGFGRRNGLKLAGMAIETIEEVTEEESSFEIVRDRSAEIGAEMVMQIKEEEGSEEVEASKANTMEVEQEEQPLVDDRQSSHISLTQPTTAIIPSSAPQSTTSDTAAVDEAAVSLSPERPPRRAARISLAPPLPAEPVPHVPVLQPVEISTVNTNPFDYAQSQSIPKKRSVRVSLAAPPSQPLRTKTARRASTSALSSQSTSNATLSRREREGRPIRVSLAPPTQSASTSNRRSSVHRDSVSPAINLRLAASTASTAQEEVDMLPQRNEMASPAKSSVAEKLTPAEGVMDALIEEGESPSAPVASTSQVPLPSTSPHALPAPLPASATSSKHATLTLPTTFSFASTSNSLTREQERQRRKEERERREKRVEEALKAKKRGMQRGAGWKKPETKSAKDVKGKGREVERDRKRPRLATSSNGSTRSRPPALHNTKPSSIAQDSSRPTEPHRPLPPPVPSISSSVVTHIEAPTQSTSSPILKLTKATLEANRVAAGPRIDLRRRVSTFLEGIVEESRPSTSMAREESPREAFRDEHELEQEMQEDEPFVLQPIETPDDVAQPPSNRQGPSAPPAPPPPPVVSRPVSRNATRPVTSKAPSSRPIAAAPARRAPPVKTTAAKPFTFAAPRSRPAPSAPFSNAGTASPMFSERLSAWKAREQETIGKGKRKAPPPMPFKTKEVQPTRPVPLTATSASVPAAKRPRVAPPAAEQGCKGKENAPSQRPIVTEKQKPVGKPIMISGGVAEEMEKRLKEKLEWSERQKKREEEVKRRREEARMSEADRERQKLQALRSSLSTNRRSTAATQAAAPPRGRLNPVGRV